MNEWKANYGLLLPELKEASVGQAAPDNIFSATKKDVGTVRKDWLIGNWRFCRWGDK